MKVVDVYYEFFKSLGYKEIFGLPGSYIMPLWQKFGEEIKIILSRHESGAVFMADGWSRNNKLPGIVLTTIGPGLTNTVTGIACAYQDSIPLIIISGYVATSMNKKGAFQNSDENDRGFLPSTLLKGITKATFLPQTADEAIDALTQAYKIAMSGRKGPVHISLPMDIQNMETNIKVRYEEEKLIIDNSWKKDFIKLYNESKRPIIFCGNGCFLSNGTNLMNEFSTKYNLPIISSIKGTSACTISNPLYLGITGNVVKEKLIQYLKEYNSDLVIALGSSLSINSFNRYEEVLKDAKIVRVDIDEKQFSNYKNANLNINMDVKYFLEEVLKLELQCKNINICFKIDEEEAANEDNIFSKIADYMYRNSTQNTLFIPDAGNHWLDILYWCYPKERLGIFTNAGLASMGHAIGAAIGLKIANKDKNVICITGDGSFMMSGMEISEAIKQNLNMTFIVVNNYSLGRARVYQEMTDRKIISTCYDIIDVEKIASGLGALTAKVESLEEFKEIYNKFNDIDKTKVIEVIVEKDDRPKILR